MDKQTLEAIEMTKNLPFKKRVENFWFYKKWWVIGALAFLIVAGVTVYEIATLPQFDLHVGFYCEKPVSEETENKLKDLLISHSTDVNGDGQITISMPPMIASRAYDTEESIVVQTKLMSELDSGNNMIYIVDKAYRDYLMSGNRRECFIDEYDLNTNPALKQEIGYDGDLYILVKDLYEREEGNAQKRASHNNAVSIFEGIVNPNS